MPTGSVLSRSSSSAEDSSTPRFLCSFFARLEVFLKYVVRQHDLHFTVDISWYIVLYQALCSQFLFPKMFPPHETTSARKVKGRDKRHVGQFLKKESGRLWVNAKGPPISADFQGRQRFEILPEQTVLDHYWNPYQCINEDAAVSFAE